LVHFTAIWYILWPFGIFYGYLVYFFPFWYVVSRKIWQHWSRATSHTKRNFAKKKLLKPFLVRRTEVIAPSAHARVRTYPLEIAFVPKLLMCRFELTASSQSAEFTTTALAL
jgi:hypothetical protein